MQKEQQKLLYDAIKKSCTKEEAIALFMSYGLDGTKTYSQIQIAEELNIPKEKIRKLVSSAQTKLKHYMMQRNAYKEEITANSDPFAHSITSNRRTTEDLRRELDSLDWSSIGEINIEY